MRTETHAPGGPTLATRTCSRPCSLQCLTQTSVHQVHTDDDVTACTKSAEGERPNKERLRMDVTSSLICAGPRIIGSHTDSGRTSQLPLGWGDFFIRRSVKLYYNSTLHYLLPTLSDPIIPSPPPWEAHRVSIDGRSDSKIACTWGRGMVHCRRR